MNNPYGWTKTQCEYLRNQAKQRFDKVRSTWLECGLWVLPHRCKWMLSQTEGERNNRHIVDPTHTTALRSYAAGFLEGNTSASRPWFRIEGQDPDTSVIPANKAWLQIYTQRTLNMLSVSNFYHSAGQVYYDYGVFNTAAYFIDELKGRLHFHVLIPGSYYVLNNGLGEAVVLVREFTLTVKALVDTYGTKTKNGSWDWSNISLRVRKMYENGNYAQTIDVVQVVRENEKYNPEQPQGLINKRWVSLTYELGGMGGAYYQDGQEFGPDDGIDPLDTKSNQTFLKVSASKRKPFIVAKSYANANFEYGETGPTLDALGLIKSLQKKAIGKDQAIELSLRPPTQGPASLKKSYVTSQAGSYVPLDPTSLSQGGMRAVFQINPAIGSLIQDQSDLRRMIEQIYYADYLLYLSRNPKTRTATETNAVVQEQQLVIGPNLQSLNYTHNEPVVEFVMSYVLDYDPYLPPPPDSLAGQFLKTEFISIFAQAQRAADLPAIDSYMQRIEAIGNMPGGQKIWDKANLDKLADLLEDRLYLPTGLNNPQVIVDAQRQQAAMEMQRQQQLHQTIPALAGAAKDLGLKAGNQNQ